MASLKRLSILGAVTLLTVAAVSVVMAQTGTGGAIFFSQSTQRFPRPRCSSV
jgi:hypothetical protein